MDRAPQTPHAALVDPERTARDHHHQGHPEPAQRPVRHCALRRGQLDHADPERSHRRKGVQRDLQRRIEQWCEVHDHVEPIVPPWSTERREPPSAAPSVADLDASIRAAQNGMSSSMSLLLRPPALAAATRRGGALDGPLEAKSPPPSSPPEPP